MLKLSKKIIAPFLSYSIFLRGCLFMPHPVYRPETTRARLPASRFACFLSQAQSRCWHCNLLPVLSITNCEPNQLHITWFLPVRPVPSCGVCLSVSPSLSNSRATCLLFIICWYYTNFVTCINQQWHTHIVTYLNRRTVIKQFIHTAMPNTVEFSVANKETWQIRIQN